MIVIFNPVAGERRHRRLHAAMDLLRDHGIRPQLLRTGWPGHATRLAAEAAAAGVATVVAAGGDGTIAEVAQGLAGTPARLGILPLGTANVLAAELGLPGNPLSAAAVLGSGRWRIIHPGIAHFTDGSSRLFVQMLGAGFDAAVVHNLNLRLKRGIGRAAYVLQALREIARYRFPVIEIRIDGAVAEARGVIISKGRFYGGCYLLAPNACPDTPGFDVALLQSSGPAMTLLAGAALPLNLLPRLPGMKLQRASRVQIISPGIPLQMDGDAAGVMPALVEDALAPITVLVP